MDELFASAGGRAAVRTVSPPSADALDALEATVWRVVDPDLHDLVARLCASVHGIVAVPRPDDLGPSPWAGRAADEWRAFGDLTAAQRTALAFAERCTVDVSAIDDDDRTALQGALGDPAVFAQAVYVADVVPRARFLLDRLFGPSPAAPGPVAPDPDVTLWERIEELIRVVPGLQALDPITTELVRLRGARQHACRICQSLRSHSALAAGADDATFAAVDHHADSSLSAAHKAALAFTDAFIWTPGRIADAVVDGLREHWSPAQQVELVLDIARNAANKPAVALGVDGTHVTEGYEVYEVAADGSITYGLAHP